MISIAHLARVLRKARDDERGVALAAVLFFMLAGIIISLLVSSTVLYAYTFTSSTRAGVQAQAAAEAGVAAARAGLLNNQCTVAGGVFTSTVEPKYSVQVYKPNGAGGWTAGCPAINEQARIVATGAAVSKGVGGDSSRDSAKVETILGGIGSSTSLVPSGPAIYAFNATGFGGSGTLLSTDGSTPDVMLRTGDVNCSGGSSGAVKLVIKSGNFTAGGSCVIGGDVWVNGAASLSGGAKIGGSLTAASVSGAAQINGNVWADGSISLPWGANVGGWVSGSSLDIAGGVVNGNGWARSGATTISGNGINGTVYGNGSVTLTGGYIKSGQVTGAGCFTGGSVDTALRVGSIQTTGGCYTPAGQSWWGGWSKITTGAATLAASPTKPSSILVPEWIDFGSKPEHFTSAGWAGYVVYVMGTSCLASDFYAALQSFGSTPGLIDARNCSNGITFNGGSNDYESNPNNSHNGFKLRSDVAIIANKIDLSGSTTFTGVTSTRKLWLINPDTVANNTPDCGTKSMSLGGGVTFTNVETMIYTPCQIHIASSTRLVGQIFANQVQVDGGAQITYTPLGLPGYDLSTGLGTSVAATEWDRPIVSQRNITG